MVSLRRNKLNTVGASEGATKTYVRSKVNELGIVRHAPMTEDYYPIITDEEHSAKGMTNSPMYRAGGVTTLTDPFTMTGDPGIKIGQDFSLHIKGTAGASAGRNTGRLQLGEDGDGGLILNQGTTTRSYASTAFSPLQIGGQDGMGNYWDCVPNWSFWLETNSSIGNVHFIIRLPDNPTEGDVYWINTGFNCIPPTGSDTVGFYFTGSTTPAQATYINGSTSSMVAARGTAAETDQNLWRVQYIDHVSHPWRGWFAQKMTSDYP